MSGPPHGWVPPAARQDGRRTQLPEQVREQARTNLLDRGEAKVAEILGLIDEKGQPT